MSESPANKFIAAIVIVVAPFAMGAFFMAWSPAGQYQLTDPHNDGYVQPRDIGGLVSNTARSTVSVFCDAPGKEGIGSAWATELDEAEYKDYKQVYITNYHVIEDCIGKEKYLTIARAYKKQIAAQIVTIDKENDLAVLASDLRVPSLKIAQYPPYVGYWVMTSGSADAYEGSVSFGTVLNSNRTEVLVTANVSHGNSGGPLVDNEGNVLGTVSWFSETEQYNGAKSIDAMCSKIIKCEGKSYWEW
ncbi:Trypsin-like peptidase domain containing protein [Candidatus Nanopelagicaceae bacterium]